jgi:four helix bundle protein
MAIIRSFRDLQVYQLAKTEAKRIFVVTGRFTHEKKYSLIDQIRRSSRARRRYPAAFVNKVDEALGEAMETQAWLDHALECGYLKPAEHKNFDEAWQHVGAMLNRMIERADDFCRTAAGGKA